MANNGKPEMYKEHADDIYRSIGRFTVQFELMIMFTRHAITTMLGMGGLKNQQLSNSMQAELGARSLLQIFSSMTLEVKEFAGAEQDIRKAIIKNFLDLVQRRNDIIHGTWFVGWASPEDPMFDDVHGTKLVNRKSGVEAKAFNYTSADFDQIADECESLGKIIVVFAGLIATKRSVENCFQISSAGKVVFASKQAYI